MRKLAGVFHVATWNSKVLIKIEGYATSHNSFFFQEVTDEMAGRGLQEFIIDLSACMGMDSTFLGVLAALQIGPHHSCVTTKVTLVNVNTYHQNLLRNLGLSEILIIKKSPVALPDIPMKAIKEERCTPQQRLKMIQEAHQALVSLNDKNKELFEEFLQLLEEETPDEKKSRSTTHD